MTPGCPIDVICNKGAGSSLLLKPRRLEEVVRAVTGSINKPVIVKIRWVAASGPGWQPVGVQELSADWVSSVGPGGRGCRPCRGDELDGLADGLAFGWLSSVLLCCEGH